MKDEKEDIKKHWLGNFYMLHSTFNYRNGSTVFCYIRFRRHKFAEAINMVCYLYSDSIHNYIYRLWIDCKISPILYGAVLLLLVAVLFTDSVNGARSWFDFGFLSIQPAEFAKIAVVLTLALVLCKIQEKDKNDINKPTKLLMALAVVGIPVLLIIKQPDYGTAAAFIVATVMMIFTAGINKNI